ncbi:DMT family transporter [Subtercola frigoramans]|uniref:Drug/metabolite transporter (DMT)-like permease n=1 Tax=Subtercola frigoramans TaxID=120298 RepID=A0ABS2L217_9MICO|nr:DMT family transporter [Subtercola frigoramans]MBM7471054.1 drug/metabolite transporter (DMT)-like permease [Subtercola frigoramans]
MIPTLLGITGAFVYGSADFLGGLASKRLNPVLVTALAAASGLVILLAVYPIVGGAFSWSAALWGALSGVAGAIALSLLYACLAIGPMSILSPLTALVSAIVPMIAGLLTGTRFGIVGYLGLAVALVAVVLVGFVPEKGAVRPSLRGVGMAIGSGVMIGVFLILINQTPEDSGIVPLLFNRAVNATLLFGAVVVISLTTGRRRAGVDAGTRAGSAARLGVSLAAGCGIVDALGNILLLTGIHLGDLVTMSVLTAMYPAGTIVLAAIVLRERIAPVQIVGLVLALSAAGMLALG